MKNMKKIIIALVVVLVVGLGVYFWLVQREQVSTSGEGAFEFTSPREGDILEAGKIYVVAWKNAPQTFAIDFETAIEDPFSREILGVAGRETPGFQMQSEGTYNWAVPSKISSGEYRLVLLVPQEGESGMMMTERGPQFTIVPISQ